MHPHQVSAPSSVDIDARQIEDGLLHVNRHLFSRAKRRGSADKIAGVPVCGIRRAWGDGFDTDNAGQFFGRNLHVSMHQNHERLLFIIFHDKRLDDGMLVYLKLTGTDLCAAMFFVRVRMIGEFYMCGAERTYRCCDGVFFFCMQSSRRNSVMWAAELPEAVCRPVLLSAATHPAVVRCKYFGYDRSDLQKSIEHIR